MNFFFFSPAVRCFTEVMIRKWKWELLVAKVSRGENAPKVHEKMDFWLSATFSPLSPLIHSPLSHRGFSPPLQCRRGGMQRSAWIPSMGPWCVWASWLILRSKTSFISTSQQQLLLAKRFIILTTSWLRNAFLNSITVSQPGAAPRWCFFCGIL